MNNKRMMIAKNVKKHHISTWLRALNQPLTMKNTRKGLFVVNLPFNSRPVEHANFDDLSSWYFFFPLQYVPIDDPFISKCSITSTLTLTKFGSTSKSDNRNEVWLGRGGLGKERINEQQDDDGKERKKMKNTTFSMTLGSKSTISHEEHVNNMLNDILFRG